MRLSLGGVRLTEYFRISCVTSNLECDREVANKSCVTKRKNINALIYNDLMLSYGCVGGLIRIFPSDLTYDRYNKHQTALLKCAYLFLGRENISVLVM